MNTFPDVQGHQRADTSIDAAHALAPKLGRLQRMALGAIREAGWSGLTTDELATRLELERCSIQPRTTELKCKGQIRDSGRRRLTKYRRPATVWIAV